MKVRKGGRDWKGGREGGSDGGREEGRNKGWKEGRKVVASREKGRACSVFSKHLPGNNVDLCFLTRSVGILRNMEHIREV